MHEMSLAEGVVSAIEQSAVENAFSQVKTVWLEIGQLSHVEPEAMRFCFDAVCKGTLVEGAKLEIIELEGRGWCHECSCEFPYQARYEPCPHCGGYQVQMTGGDEMRIKELEVE